MRIKIKIITFYVQKIFKYTRIILIFQNYGISKNILCVMKKCTVVVLIESVKLENGHIRVLLSDFN